MTKLTCSEFDRLLIENVTGDGADRERLRYHAESCPRCAAIWQQEQMLDAAILAWKCDPPEVDLVQRVLARRADELPVPVPAEVTHTPRATPHSPVPRGYSHFAVLALAAVAGLMLAISLPFSGSPPGNPPGDHKLTQTSRNAVPSVSPASAGSSAAKNQNQVDDLEVEQVIADLRTRYSGVSRRVVQTIGGLRFEWPGMAGVGVDLIPATPPSPATANGSKKSSAGWSDGLRPIERDIRKAFSFLRDAVPDIDGSSI